MEMTREDYQKKVEGHLKQWSGRLTALQAKATKAGEDTKKGLADDLTEFKRLQEQGAEHLKAVQAAASASWKDVSKGLNNTWNNVSGAVDALWARVK